MLFRDDSKTQRRERGLNTTELGAQEASRLDFSLKHRLIRDTLQTFFSYMGPTFRALI